jgi:glycosyltransferase involved in cell wall biosynthesis
MIGQGPLENLIIEKIRTYNLQSRVVIVPWMQHEDVLKEYAKADLFFFPSFEGAGMVVVEALSNGLPVVCFDNSGPGEIVGDSDLKIPLIGSYNQVVKNFSNLIITYFYKSEEEKNEYSRNAQKRYELMYDWKVKGDRIVNIIRDVL